MEDLIKEMKVKATKEFKNKLKLFDNNEDDVSEHTGLAKPSKEYLKHLKEDTAYD